MHDGSGLGYSKRLPRAEFQGLYKSCISKGLRNITLIILRSIAPEQMTHLPLPLLLKLRCHQPGSQVKDRSLFSPSYLIFSDSRFFFPPLFFFLLFSRSSLFFSDYRGCNDRVDAPGVRTLKAVAGGSPAGLGTVVELGF